MVYTVGLVMSNNSLSLYIIHNIRREIQVYLEENCLEYTLQWFYKGLLIFFKLCVCVPVCRYVLMSASSCGYLEVSDLLELELEVVANYQTWVLRTTVGSSEGTVFS